MTMSVKVNRKTECVRIAFDYINWVCQMAAGVFDGWQAHSYDDCTKNGSK